MARNHFKPYKLGSIRRTVFSYENHGPSKPDPETRQISESATGKKFLCATGEAPTSELSCRIAHIGYSMFFPGGMCKETCHVAQAIHRRNEGIFSSAFLDFAGK